MEKDYTEFYQALESFFEWVGSDEVAVDVEGFDMSEGKGRFTVEVC